jgi:hypothetical protein
MIDVKHYRVEVVVGDKSNLNKKLSLRDLIKASTVLSLKWSHTPQHFNQQLLILQLVKGKMLTDQMVTSKSQNFPKVLVT